MAKLDRMNLMGIRSFGPDVNDVQKITFESPLTLIQGQNGCGKTTIIEAIKFAITGELPGGTARGQGFVYDPKLSKSFESIGKIKLRVLDGRGELVTVFKVVRVAQKGPDKLEFKRLDSTISRRRDNEPTHASNRCADVDQEMCIVLGVSKAIINEVLFCHQEDSNWPLEESKKLKERFDEIFDAAKYNKCTDHIDKKIKEKVEKARLIKVQVEILEEKKLYAERKKLEMHDKIAKYREFTSDIEKIGTKLVPLNKRINELYLLEQNFSKLYSNIESKKKVLELLEQQRNELLQNVKEFDGTDDELNSKINQFEGEIKVYEEDIDTLKQCKRTFAATEQELSKKINLIQNKLGVLQAEVDHNEKNKTERNEIIESLTRDFELRVKDKAEVGVPIIINTMTEILNGIRAKNIVKEAEMQKLQEEKQVEIDIAREQNAQLEQKIASQKQQLEEYQKEVRTIKNKLEELNTADDQLKLSENKLQRIEREIKSLETTVDIEQLKQLIEKDKSKLKELQDRSQVVEHEVRRLQQYANIQTELDLKNEQLLNKQDEMTKLMNKHSDSLCRIFDNVPPKTDLKAKLESLIQEKREQFKNKLKETNAMQEKMLKAKNLVSTYNEKIAEKRKELEENQLKIDQMCDGKPLEQETEKTKNKLRDLNDKRGSLTSSTFLYKNFIKNFQEDRPCCPLCKRNVEEKQMVEQIIKDINKQIENLPNELNHIDKVLGVETKWHDNLLTLHPINEKNKKLRKEIPEIDDQCEKYRLEASDCYEKHVSLDRSTRGLESQLNSATMISGDVSLIDQCQKEIAQLREQIGVLEKSLPGSNDSFELGKRSIEEAIDEKENISTEIRSLQTTIESLQLKILQHTERLHLRRDQKNQILSQQLTIKKNLQDKDHLVTKSIEIEDKILALSTGLVELEESVEPSKQELQKLIKNKIDLKATHQQRREKFNNSLNKTQKKMDLINGLQSEIIKFTAKKVNEQIENAQKEMIGCKKSIDDFAFKRNDIDIQVDDLKLRISNGQMYYRELQDNIQLREKKNKVDTLRKEIIIEERNLGENDIKEIRNEKSKLVDECDTLVQVKHRTEGEKTQLKSNIAELKKELAQPEYANAVAIHKNKYLDYHIIEAIVTDMKEFSKAMRWSMMQYHKQRMVHVNSIVKELWRTIYKGNDIDYIEIKTDDIQTKGHDKRNVYSYKVVQVKNEVELEMRGRCSAGQRVLASLIIRIALAETFSNNCGILALDEPTTNLDRENINSLADALIELIQQKRQQKHFQLLIITHDQEFVDRLTQMESLDRYYEIKRSPVGKSIITVHNRY